MTQLFFRLGLILGRIGRKWVICRNRLLRAYHILTATLDENGD